ncbi:hypothetical protein K501DRAFT_277382 [Backusella circina FSU 941]|nr:hypothetical protein K501DRAFT_277382 [Backusella circina FSU 941]
MFEIPEKAYFLKRNTRFLRVGFHFFGKEHDMTFYYTLMSIDVIKTHSTRFYTSIFALTLYNSIFDIGVFSWLLYTIKQKSWRKLLREGYHKHSQQLRKIDHSLVSGTAIEDVMEMIKAMDDTMKYKIAENKNKKTGFVTQYQKVHREKGHHLNDWKSYLWKEKKLWCFKDLDNNPLRSAFSRYMDSKKNVLKLSNYDYIKNRSYIHNRINSKTGVVIIRIVQSFEPDLPGLDQYIMSYPNYSASFTGTLPVCSSVIMRVLYTRELKFKVALEIVNSERT